MFSVIYQCDAIRYKTFNIKPCGVRSDKGAVNTTCSVHYTVVYMVI